MYGRAQDTFTAVPAHLYYILCELLKNSCRATVEHAKRQGVEMDALPPVKIIIARGREDMAIKVLATSTGSLFELLVSAPHGMALVCLASVQVGSACTRQHWACCAI